VSSARSFAHNHRGHFIIQQWLRLPLLQECAPKVTSGHGVAEFSGNPRHTAVDGLVKCSSLTLDWTARYYNYCYKIVIVINEIEPCGSADYDSYFNAQSCNKRCVNNQPNRSSKYQAHITMINMKMIVRLLQLLAINLTSNTDPDIHAWRSMNVVNYEQIQNTFVGALI
jgi:hypothetical protein